jgi:hypothetical protein
MYRHIAAHPQLVHTVRAIDTVSLTERTLETPADLRMR